MTVMDTPMAFRYLHVSFREEKGDFVSWQAAKGVQKGFLPLTSVWGVKSSVGRAMLAPATAALRSPSGTGSQQGHILPALFQHSTSLFFCCQTPSQHGWGEQLSKHWEFCPHTKGD